MADPTESEMMADLQTADAAGDTQLAQHIADRIKSARAATPKDKTWGETIGSGVNSFFGRGDPKKPEAFAPRQLGQQYLKAASLLVPGTGLASMGTSGALYGAGASDAPDLAGVAKDAAVGSLAGAAAGKVLSVAGKGLGWIGRKGVEKSGLASARAGAKAAEEVGGEVASAAGKYGGEVQKGSRYVENLMRLESEMTPAQKALYQELQTKGVVPNLQQQVAQSTLEALPGQASSIAARQAELAAAQEGAPAAVLSRTKDLLSTNEAKHQLAERAWRYGPVALGSAVGTALGGPLGTAVGALSGAGTRPMVQALRRMVKTPAIQKKIGDAMQSVGDNSLAHFLEGVPVESAAGVAGRTISPEIKALAEYLRNAAGRPKMLPAGAQDEGTPK